MGYLRMRGNGWKEGMEAGLGSKGALIPLRPGYLRAMPRKTWNAPIARQYSGPQFPKNLFSGLQETLNSFSAGNRARLLVLPRRRTERNEFMNTLKFFAL